MRYVLLMLALAACSGSPPDANRTTPASPRPRSPSDTSRTPRTTPPSDSEAPPSAPTTGDPRAPLRPCAPGTPAHTAARSELTALGARIEALPDDAAPAPLNAALAELLRSPCFALAAPPQTALEADSARALRTFWEDGGASWLASPLAIAESRRFVTAPSMRRSLRASHPLVCRATDRACGEATRRWRRRAETGFYEDAKERRQAAIEDPDTPHPSEATCAAEAKEVPPAQQFTRWSDCVAKLPLRLTALPVGDTRVPEAGWLILRGRRGHYNFCDEVRAYDLATGSAFVAKRCGGLMLGPGGVVDGDQTDARRRALVIEQGLIPLDLVREAAWMTLLSPEVEQGVVRARAYPLPPWMNLERSPTGVLTGGSGSMAFSSAQTRLSWSYMRAGSAEASGTLTWPYDFNDVAKDYAVTLIKQAEAALVAGCALARPPRHLDFGLHRPGVSPLDADEDSLSQTERALLDALAAAPLRRCR